MSTAIDRGERDARRAEGGSLFVVRPSRGPAIVAPSGASAALEGDAIALRDASGRLLLTFDGATGDLCLSAPGRVKIEGGAGVEITGPSVAVSAGRFELRAERIFERATDAFRTIEGILETRAEHARMLAARTLEIFGRRTSIRSEEDTRVDGKRVLLG